MYKISLVTVTAFVTLTSGINVQVLAMEIEKVIIDCLYLLPVNS